MVSEAKDAQKISELKKIAVVFVMANMLTLEEKLPHYIKNIARVQLP